MQLIVAIVIVIIIYSLSQKIYRKYWDKELAVDIHFTKEYVTAGEGLSLVLQIANSKFLPLPVFHVKFATSRTFVFDNRDNTSVTDAYHRNDVFSVMGNEKIIRTLDFSTTQRGYYSVTETRIIAKDFFMTKTFAKNLEERAYLYVLPQKPNLNRLELAFSELLGEMEIRRNLQEDPFTFRGIREYRHGDLMKDINQKATAKTGKLLVNVHQFSAEPKVTILLNLEPNAMLKIEAMQELCIELASAVAEYFLRQNVMVKLASNGSDLVTNEIANVGEGATSGHLLTIDKTLARIEKNQGLEVFFDLLGAEIQKREENTSYVIISAYRKDDLLQKVDYLSKTASSVLLISPYYDIEQPSSKRGYMYGWEVKYDEV